MTKEVTGYVLQYRGQGCLDIYDGLSEYPGPHASYSLLFGLHVKSNDWRPRKEDNLLIECAKFLVEVYSD